MTRWFGSLRMMYQHDKPQRLPRIERDPARVVFFSDAVFAIAVTLLVLGIEPPDDFGNLPDGLGRLWPSYLAYAISFLLIGQVWVNHHVMFEHIRSIDRRVLFLNTLL
ncbi:MAG TPA: TMEM175 family protein, partial [Asanoa sp.]|nr:TMEM175 family protein [Asanoa sp.]